MARPRVFDVDKAIHTAMDLFWRNGYERTSLAELTSAMGITPPSFYFAFGNKERLFKRVVDHYGATRLSQAHAAIDEPTARDVAEKMLYKFADLYTDDDPSLPRGCLVVNCALPSADDEGTVRTELGLARERRRERLRDRFQHAKDTGDLPPDADPDALARYLMVVGWGLAFAAQSGATRSDLYRTVQIALAAWPT